MRDRNAVSPTVFVDWSIAFAIAVVLVSVLFRTLTALAWDAGSDPAPPAPTRCTVELQADFEWDDPSIRFVVTLSDLTHVQFTRPITVPVFLRGYRDGQDQAQDRERYCRALLERAEADREGLLDMVRRAEVLTRELGPGFSRVEVQRPYGVVTDKAERLARR